MGFFEGIAEIFRPKSKPAEISKMQINPQAPGADVMAKAATGVGSAEPQATNSMLIGPESYVRAKGASQLGEEVGNTKLAANAHKEAVKIAQGK